jgi:kanamycin kinase
VNTEEHPVIPRELRAAYTDWEWTVVWRRAPQTATYRLCRPDGDVRYLKLTVSDWFPELAAERERMIWARPHLPVPSVLGSGENRGVCWLMTQALPGLDATHPTLTADPGSLVRLLAAGLRRFHRSPAESCPFDFRLDAALEHVERRVANGDVDRRRDFHSEHQHLTVQQAVAQLERTRPGSEDLVVCHGDYCLPNVLIDRDEVTGLVDLGELGVADRWRDLAVATWSVTWNLGPGYEEAFLAAYGIELDPNRLAYYRLLYDLVS